MSEAVVSPPAGKGALAPPGAGQTQSRRQAPPGTGRPPEAAVQRVEVDAYTIPTDQPEADGTLSWDSTTIVVVHAHAGGRVGVGYTYSDAAAAGLIATKLRDVVVGCDALAPRSAWADMTAAIRNVGRPGLGAMAVSAVDTALWDLHARLFEVPLCQLLGRARDHVPVYGSGGFTTYDLVRLGEQLGGWARSGIPRVKMKVGSDPDADPDRVAAAREAIGVQVELFVDANGAYSIKQALALGQVFRDKSAVTWFEEPVPSDDLAGLALLRQRLPAGMDVAAGEYGDDARYFERMLAAEAVDVLQADVTRCLGITGLLQVGALCEAHGRSLSLHCAPALHLHPGCAVDRLRHLEYFHDHVRIEHMLFDGVREPESGALVPALDRPGNGLELRRPDAERFRA